MVSFGGNSSRKKVLKSTSHEIIFVDDNSPDGTSAVIKDCIKNSSKIRLIHRIGRKGLAGAVIEGVFAANADLVAVMDCDLQHDESKLLDMINLFSKNNSLDIVIGSRFTETGEISEKAFSKMEKSGSKMEKAFSIFLQTAPFFSKRFFR